MKKFFILLPLAFLFAYCGKSPEEVKKEEGKLELSAPEKVELAKKSLEIGLVSDAKKLFSEALPQLNKAECKDGKIGKTCLYCDALYGKFLADFYATLGLLGQLLEQLQKEEEKQTSPIYTKQSDPLLSQSVELILGKLLEKIDSQRKDLQTIIQDNCEFSSSATVSLKLLSLNIVIPARSEEKKEFLYSSLFAKTNYAILSLLAGVIDILYSQNYSVSAKEVFNLLKEIIKLSEAGKSLVEIIPYTGDFFAKNPEFLTQNNNRVNLWGKSAKDFSESLSYLSQVISDVSEGCKSNKTNEATFLTLNSIFSLLPVNIGDFCGLLNIIGESIEKFSNLLSRWSKGFSGELKCNYEEDQGKRKIKRFAEDGCIRFPDDITKILSIGGILSNLLPPVKLSIELGALFSVPTPDSPKHLRALLPLTTKQGDKFVFVIQVEPQGDVFSGMELFTLEKGAPEKIQEDISIPKKCFDIAGISLKPKIFIPFADPTFFGSLYFNAACKEDESLNVGNDEYFELPDNKRKGNFAINALISPILSLIIR